MLHDVRLAVRALLRRPGITLAAVLTLALGIGALTTLFGVVDAVILRPLPFASPEGLVQIVETTPRGAKFSVSEPDYLDFAAQNRALVGLAAYRPAELTLTGAGSPLQLHIMATSASLFPLLGERLMLGRPFRPDEDAAGDSSRVVVLGHRLWSRTFSSDSSVVGRTVTLDARPYTVVGVLPARFHFPEADAYLPLRADARSDRTDRWLTLVGRLGPGVSVARAQSDFDRIASAIGTLHPENHGWGARVERLSHVLVDDGFRRAGWVLLGATGLLLVLACANVANLLLARAIGRRTEMGVRAAIGASRGRLVRQMLTESGMLALVAAGAGVLIAIWSTTAVRTFGAGRIPRLDEVGVDMRAIGVAALLGVITTFACGLVPALRASRLDAAVLLAEGPRAGTSRRHRRERDALVVFQIALSVVLLVGAGLLLRSFARLGDVDTGFDARRVLAVNLTLPAQRYDGGARARFFERLAASLSGLPGVAAVGAGAVDPFSGWNYSNDVTPEDRLASTPPSGFMQAGWRSVTPGYFAAMRIPVVRGRPFTREESSSERPVAVSRVLAERLWPGQDAVGKRLYWGGTNGRPRLVVAVVGDVRDVSPQRAPEPMVYVPYDQVPLSGMTLLVRTTRGDPLALVAPVRAAIRAIDPLLPASDIHPLERNWRDALTSPRFNLQLMAIFAALALLLAASGIFSTIAFNVATRRREIAIRIAMGAAPVGVVHAFVGDALRLAAVGAVAGLAGAWGAGRVIRGLLFQIGPGDPITFAAVAMLLAMVALLASYLPARRASAVAPMEVLGRE